ncbi:MAG: hypothetical protein ACI8S6_001442 [Myxococcota bacterium]|jgi:hypothetical protein
MTLIALFCASALAQAPDPAIIAEQTRLVSELQKLAARETWEGVEGLYRQLLTLEAQGSPLTYAEHILGAQAARASGNATATHTRLLRAVALRETPLARDWISEIEARYGQASIQIPARRRDENTLAAVRMPFQSDQRFAIDYARDALSADARFSGLLPAGDYTIGDKTFSILPGTTTTLDLTGRQRAESTPEPSALPEPEPEPEVVRRERPTGSGAVVGQLRVGLGAGGAGATRTAGIEPLPFVGFGPGGSLGAAYYAASGLGGGVELGGGLVRDGESSLGLGHGWLFFAWQRQRLTVSAGPVVGGGRATLVGLDGAALALFCAEQPKQSCSGLSQSITQIEAAVARGRVQASGGALGVDVQLAETGAVHWALGADVGGLSDGARGYSWARLGVVARFGAQL